MTTMKTRVSDVRVSKNYCFLDGKWEKKKASKYFRHVCIQCDGIGYSCDKWINSEAFICSPGCYHGAHAHANANIIIGSLRRWNQWSKDHV